MIDQDNRHTKLAALNVDFSSLSPDALRLKKFAHASIKRGYQLKMFFSRLVCLAWKQLQISTDVLLIIKSTGDVLYSGINVNDLYDLKPQKWGFWMIFMRLLAAKKVNCDEMDGYRPRLPASRNCCRLLRNGNCYRHCFSSVLIEDVGILVADNNQNGCMNVTPDKTSWSHHKPKLFVLCMLNAGITYRLIRYKLCVLLALAAVFGSNQSDITFKKFPERP